MAGASGYAGGEMLRLLLGPPRGRDRGADRRLERRAAVSGGSTRTCTPLADRVLWRPPPATLAGHDVVFLALPHGAVGGARGRSCPTDVVVDRLRRRPPARPTPAAWERFYGTPHAGTWPYGLPELPLAGGAQAARRARGRTPDRRAGLLPDGRSPGPRARLRRRAARAAGRRRSSPPPAPRAPAGRSSRTCSAPRSWASMSPYGVGGVHRHTPEIEQNLGRAAGAPGHASRSPRRWRRCPAASSPPAPPGPPPGVDGARASAPPGQKAYADEPFVHLLPEGQWPRTGDVARRQRRARAGRARRARRPGRRRRRRSTT